MSLAHKKSFWWHLLGATFGALALFVLLCVTAGELPGRTDLIIYIWPVSALILIVISSIRLRRLYCAEPCSLGGWQFSLGELLFLLLLMGSTLTTFSMIDPNNVLFIGLPITLFGAMLVLFGFLAAKRAGYTPEQGTLFFALGIAARIYGTFGLGAVVTLVVIMIFEAIPKRLPHFLNELFFLVSDSENGEAWFVNSLRLAWICFALSFVFFWLAKRFKPTPAPEIPPP